MHQTWHLVTGTGHKGTRWAADVLIFKTIQLLVLSTYFFTPPNGRLYQLVVYKILKNILAESRGLRPHYLKMVGNTET